MSGHARLSPSSSYRWSRCPGSVHLIEALADTERETFEITHDNEYIRFGTAAHSLAEAWLKHPGPVPPIAPPDGVEADELLEVVQPYVEYIRERSQGRDLYVEQRISLAEFGPPEPIFGTADAIICDPEWLEIADLKSGQGVKVDPAGNKQLILYAAGAIHAGYETYSREKKAYLTIVQPRAGGISTWETTVGEVIDAAREIVGAAWDVKPGAALVPGEWCRFCPAQGHCPALSKHAQLIAQMDFAAVPVDTPPAPETIPLALVADLLDKEEVLKNWFSALRARITRELEAGREVPGWKLVGKRPRRVWVSADELEKWGRSVFGPAFELTLYQRELLSPAQVEKVVGKKNLPAELYSSVSSGLTLVPASDPRPAAAIGPAEEFAALPPAALDAELLEGA